MINSQPNTSCQLGYGKSFCLAGSVLMMLTTMGSAVAEDATGKAIPDATKEVSFAETLTRTGNGSLGEIVPLGDHVVTVVPGDSLSSILRGSLGSLSALREVSRYNNLDTPDTLEPGQEIRIPAYLFPIQPDTQPMQLVAIATTESESPLQSAQSEQPYLVVDLTELAATTDPESTLQSTDSEEQYLVVDLSQISPATDAETTTQSTASEAQYLVVDLTDVETTPDRRIRVNRGDSLSSILRENLGSLRALREVSRYNSLDSPDDLQPGQILLIPGYL